MAHGLSRGGAIATITTALRILSLRKGLADSLASGPADSHHDEAS